MQEEHAPLGAVAVGRAFQNVDQVRKSALEAEDRVFPAVVGVVKKAVPSDLVLVHDNLFGPLADDHVVEALVGRARHARVAPHNVQVLGKTAAPVFFLVVVKVLTTRDQRDQIQSRGHVIFPS